MLQPGTQIGRYEIQRRLGRGGMGTVYVAHDPVLGRMVAIKVFLTDLDLPDAVDRFTREARSAAALNHANIVTIHDFGEYASQPYIVMEYVQGETLAEIIRRKAAVSLTDKLRWMEELCAGAAYAHRIGVIHRDIKPTNLMIDRTGRLKILDFGIAKMLGAFASNATALVGTPGYMAPEQILGGAIDNRSDLFSIGVVCYELFSLTDAFPGETIPAITHRILSQDPPPLAGVASELPADACVAVERAIKKAPADRFDDAEALRVVLGRVRRQLENAGGFDTMAPTILSTRPPTPPANRPSTGSQRKRVSDVAAVGELTPPPDLQLTDRESLARRRTAQIEAAVERGRAALQRGDLDIAHDECLQALTLDDNHAGALELESSITIATARRRALTLLEEARGELGRGALTIASNLLQEARGLDPEAADIKRLERDLRLARVEQERIRQRAEAVQKAVDAAEQALAQGEVEAALAFARQAIELQPDSEKARALEADAMRRLDEETGAADEPAADAAAPTILSSLPAARVPAAEATVAIPAPAAATIIAPAARRTPAPQPAAAVVAPTVALPAPTVKTPAPQPAAKDVKGKEKAKDAKAKDARPRTDYAAAARAWIASVQTSIAAQPKQQRMLILGGIAAVVVLAIVLAVVALVPRGAVPTGAVVIDAVPWATVTSIEAEDGTRQALPAVASTPLALTLPVGTYRVQLAGPPPASESRQITVQVQADGVVSPVEQFRALTPDEYFEQYLSSAAPASDPAATAPGAPAAPSAAPPAAPTTQGAVQ